MQTRYSLTVTQRPPNHVHMFDTTTLCVKCFSIDITQRTFLIFYRESVVLIIKKKEKKDDHKWTPRVLLTCYQNNSVLARETIKAKLKKETRKYILQVCAWNIEVVTLIDILRFVSAVDTDAMMKLKNILSNLSVSRLVV